MSVRISKGRPGYPPFYASNAELPSQLPCQFWQGLNLNYLYVLYVFYYGFAENVLLEHLAFIETLVLLYVGHQGLYLFLRESE